MKASPAHSGRLPEQVLRVVGREPVLVHHDAGGKADSAAGDGLQGQSRSPVLRLCHQCHQPLVIYERNQPVPDERAEMAPTHAKIVWATA